jgi:Right handed beta helix region
MNILYRAGVPVATLALLTLTLSSCGSTTSSTGSISSADGIGSASGISSASGQHAAVSASQAPATSALPSGTAAAASSSCATSGSMPVSSAGELASALGKAQPGETIVLAPGSYDGDFTASHSGTANAPVTLCGPRSAVLDGGSMSRGYTLYLDHVSWWRVEGFTVEGGQKGVITDGSDYDLLTGLFVHSVGDEGIHLRDFSSHDTISHCLVQDTGQLVAFYGEGMYVGSAHKNWCRYSGCQPDRSDDDVIKDNDISATSAENIDIKEGTAGGEITGNRFNGAGMVASAATGWVNVKGNDWTISGNTGTGSLKDGFQVHQVYPGWGLGNVFRGNTAQVNGPGYGFFVQNKRLRTVVACDNVVSSAGRGFSTIACTPA